MQSEYVDRETLERVLFYVPPQTLLILRVSLETGLRISDVLSLTRSSLKVEKYDCKIYYIAKKTKKRGKTSIPLELYDDIMKTAGDRWLFPGVKADKPKTRQAVWKSLKRACMKAQVSENVTPHSCRKIFAVELYHNKGLPAVKEALQHNSDELTKMYAYSDMLRTNRDFVTKLADIIFARVESQISSYVRGIVTSMLKAERENARRAENCKSTTRG